MTHQDNCRVIPLTRGQVAIVSPEDFELLSQFKWYANRERRGNYYAVRSIAKGKIQMMHRVICGTPDGMITDHINRNTLDNRRDNLRVVTAFENQQNRRISRNNKSGYLGVFFDKKACRWVAAAMAFGKRMPPASFHSPEAAYAARCAWLEKLVVPLRDR